MLNFRDRLPRGYYLIALLAGLLLPLAFAPFEWRPFAWIAPAIFFWLNLKPMQNAQRLWLAWWFGVGMFAAGTHWIYVSIHFFGGANSAIAAAMVAVFVLGMAFMLMVFAMIANRFVNQTVMMKLLLIFPAAWALTEWFRGWFLTGFPWLQLGHSQIDYWTAHYATIVGSLGVSWIVALGAGALVLVLTGKWAQRTVAVLLVGVVVAGGWGLSTVTWTQKAGDPLYVSMIQGNIAQQDKWKPELRNQHIQTHIDLMAPHISNSHVVIWPETAIPATFQDAMDDVILPLQEAAQQANTTFVVGGFEQEPADADAPSSQDGMPPRGKIYNAIMAINERRQVYGKRHLVPFSEYIPLLDYMRWLGKYIMLPYSNVDQWQGATNLNIAGHSMRMSVCYEDAYGHEMLDGLPDAAMLVNLSNDGWFTGSIEPAQHAEIARMRALETSRYLLRATNNGVSQIVDHKGRVVKSAPQYEQAVIAEYAQPMKGSTPYIRWGDWFILIWLLGLLAVAYVRGRNKFY